MIQITKSKQNLLFFTRPRPEKSNHKGSEGEGDEVVGDCHVQEEVVVEVGEGEQPPEVATYHEASHQ